MRQLRNRSACECSVHTCPTRIQGLPRTSRDAASWALCSLFSGSEKFVLDIDPPNLMDISLQCSEVVRRAMLSRILILDGSKFNANGDRRSTPKLVSQSRCTLPIASASSANSDSSTLRARAANGKGVRITRRSQRVLACALCIERQA